MALIGEEKEIRALFYELKLADESLAPGFNRTWERALSRTSTPHRALKFTLALLTVLVISIVFSIGLWSQKSQRPESNVWSSTRVAATGTVGTTSTVTVEQPDHVKPNSRRIASRRRTATNGFKTTQIRQAEMIFSWQSPTENLMQSPAGEVLTAMPQLDQSVTELKSFLPGAEK